jgi:hypothetical protein
MKSDGLRCHFFYLFGLSLYYVIPFTIEPILLILDDFGLIT